MVTATVSSKGQIVIPQAIRKRLNLKAGTQVAIDVNGESLVMKRLVSEFPDWRSMQGMAKGGPSLTDALVAERASELARDAARVEGQRKRG
jgi:AbrB family looped-hinge helix DNA binding protein